ncbi:cytochrome P450 [Talaromyces proteolyticus]|uniref:Cytochrome P450 n=1 Tax=Talaromyces proteolyticus TaxID=1131652 RepID=A0AAD4PWN4_9EURO|nr:cytochrome P450 [Talaromyces proteolyticus]KAH8691814.1 cytochrome P450 [Talaromyces proteolyticus]
MSFPGLIMPLTGAICVGVTIHLIVFSRGEWERHVVTIMWSIFLCQALICAATLRFYGGLYLQSLLYTLTTMVGFSVGVFTSMSIYRIYFHRLRQFPGPLGARLSGFWSMGTALRGFQLYKKTQTLHRFYGDFVRIRKKFRPREISINHVDAIRDIHGIRSKCTKGPFYDLNYPSRSLQMTRDKSFHSKRKQVWEKGFTSSALSQYEPRILHHSLVMAHQLSKRTQQPEDITKWIQFFGFDVMGDLVFGKSFRMLEEGRPHFILGQMAAMGPVVGSLICVPWLFILFQNLPVISHMRNKWIGWCKSQVEDRKTFNSSRVDLFSFLLPPSIHSEGLEADDLIYDSELAIVAGSDTTSTTLAALLYLLTQEPEKQEILRQEVDRLCSSPQEVSNQILSKNAPYLDGCIKEALRLYPAVPSGVQRMTPPEGAVIAGRLIPGDTLVSTPTYAIHRDPRYFVQPDAFLPQRWSSQSHLLLKQEAFNPFLIGQHSCVGKQLAMMEMRILVAVLVLSFNFHFHDDGLSQRSHKTKCRGLDFQDYFTARVGPVEVLLENRAIG